MFINTTTTTTDSDSGICIQQSLLKIRTWNDVTSTAKSFKSWHTCMENKACKIIAIVLICIGGIIALWLIGSLLSMFKNGVTGVCDFICWCCPRRRNYDDRDMNKQANYQMQPQTHIIQQPVYVQEPSAAMYNGRKDLHSYYDEFGSSKSKEEDLKIEEQAFDLNAQKKKSSVKEKFNFKNNKNDSNAEQVAAASNNYYNPQKVVSDEYTGSYTGAGNSHSASSHPYDNTNYGNYQQYQQSKNNQNNY